MATLNYNFEEIQDPYIHRQASEHERLDRFVQVNSDLIDYQSLKNSKLYPHPPISYKIIYKVRSIVAINTDQMPIYGDYHEMEVKLPQDFPEQPAHCKMLTDTWHPNIKSEGSFKGAICTNSAGFGSLFFLDELITRIGEFLQYKKYMAEERAPWPEDAVVARWVREIGEPQGIIDKDNGKFVDDQDWKLWDDGMNGPEGEITFFEKDVEDETMDDEDTEDEDTDGEDDFTIEEI